jgi:hypothetical protein
VRVELGLLESRLPLECSQGCAACGKGCGVEVLLRPDDVIHDDQAGLLAEVRHKAFRGAEILYSLRLESGVEVLSLVPSHHNHAIGERIGIRLDVDHVVAFKTCCWPTDTASSPGIPLATPSSGGAQTRACCCGLLSCTSRAPSPRC